MSIRGFGRFAEWIILDVRYVSEIFVHGFIYGICFSIICFLTILGGSSSPPLTKIINNQLISFHI